jgi:hypothetical protein
MVRWEYIKVTIDRLWDWQKKTIVKHFGDLGVHFSVSIQDKYWIIKLRATCTHTTPSINYIYFGVHHTVKINMYNFFLSNFTIHVYFKSEEYSIKTTHQIKREGVVYSSFLFVLLLCAPPHTIGSRFLCKYCWILSVWINKMGADFFSTVFLLINFSQILKYLPLYTKNRKCIVNIQLFLQKINMGPHTSKKKNLCTKINHYNLLIII